MQQRCCLIVVEDEALLRLVIEMTLREDTDLDFRVLSTVGAALEVLEAEAERLDFLVTNIDLGDVELTGFDLARRARELNPDIFVVYISGASGHLFETEKVPGAIFLPKPFEADRLLAVLRNRCAEENPPEPPQAMDDTSRPPGPGTP